MRRSYSVPGPVKALRQTDDPESPSKQKRRILGYVLLAVAGLVIGVVCYIFLLLGQPLRTQISIVDRSSMNTVSLDQIKLTESGDTEISWSEGGRTRVYVHEDFPIIKVEQRDPLIENVLVFGIDARKASEVVCRADSLILVTVDRKNQVVKLTSILRDTQVDISGRSEPDRINAAYAYGGVGLLVNTLNETLDLDIQRFAMFDFWSAASLIDSVNGVDIDVSGEEVPFVNQGIQEQNLLAPENQQSPLLDQSGLQVLDGRQAVAWARIRKLDSDYVRTSRQRTILINLMRQVSKARLATLLNLANSGINAFETNMSSADMIRIGLNAAPLTEQILEYRIPEDGLYTVNPDPWMMIVDWDKQVAILHQFIWGDLEK